MRSVETAAIDPPPGECPTSHAISEAEDCPGSDRAMSPAAASQESRSRLKNSLRSGFLEFRARASYSAARCSARSLVNAIITDHPCFSWRRLIPSSRRRSSHQIRDAGCGERDDRVPSRLRNCAAPGMPTFSVDAPQSYIDLHSAACCACWLRADSASAVSALSVFFSSTRVCSSNRAASRMPSSFAHAMRVP